jgi:hypothetical protein
MSIHDITVMDMSLDDNTFLPENFTCNCQILILSPNLEHLPRSFLSRNVHVKKLDMSKCRITEIPDFFCSHSHIEDIIWPPNITRIQSDCFYNNRYIQKVDLSYCNQLTIICGSFCECAINVDVILPISIEYIGFNFLLHNEKMRRLDLTLCINLTRITSYFCVATNIQIIKFPKSLRKIGEGLSGVQELDFSICENVKINTEDMENINTLKLYSIDNIKVDMLIHNDNIKRRRTIKLENLHIYNITKTQKLDLSFIKNLRNVYLPEKYFCIIDKLNKQNISIYIGVRFWINHMSFPVSKFTDLKLYNFLPVKDLALVDVPLETI